MVHDHALLQIFLYNFFENLELMVMSEERYEQFTNRFIVFFINTRKINQLSNSFLTIDTLIFNILILKQRIQHFRLAFNLHYTNLIFFIT